jgi:hypothetical protein
MKALHFIMVYNADGIDTAKDIAERELKRFGMKNIGTANWYEIGSFSKRSKRTGGKMVKW